MAGAYFFIALGAISCVLLLLSRYQPDHVMFPIRVADREIFEQDFAPYRDSFGLIQNNPGGSSGNGLRYTAEYYTLKFRYGLVTKDDTLQFEAIVRRCFAEPGLLNRKPDDKSPNKFDDYVAVSTASLILELLIANDIKTYGLKNHWYFNNAKTSLSFKDKWGAWFGKDRGLIAHFFYADHDTPSWFNTIAWTFNILLCAYTAKDSQDEWVLSAHQIVAYEWSKDRTWPQDKACQIWRKQFRKQWGVDGMSKLLEKYFGHKHPLSKYALDI